MKLVGEGTIWRNKCRSILELEDHLGQTRISARNGGRFPMTRIQRIILGDEPLPAGHGTREMPVWGPIFSQIAWDQDLGRVRVDNLARYIEEMQTK